jgi:Domain of unknown function (DUF4917)
VRERAEQQDAALARWSDVAQGADWTGLLVGNGASIAVWPQFRYPSLFGVATSADIEHPLTDEDRRLFTAFETENFEQVLAALNTAGVVADALGLGLDVLRDRYESIQRGLFEAVHAVHVPWDHVGTRAIPRLFDILRDYRFVYSTNYDLLLYWASMEKGGEGFLDYFWGPDGTFAAFDTGIWPIHERWTRILFLHGGIHLRRLRAGGTRKVLASEGSLLEQFSTAYSGDESPLLVSEGESKDKLASIMSSDYLAFGHQSFASHERGLVIFGHTLGDQDDHLVFPMRSWRETPVAISIRPGDDEDRIVQAKDRFRSRLSPMKDIVFFDSTTHPLGDAELEAQAPTRGLFRRG